MYVQVSNCQTLGHNVSKQKNIQTENIYHTPLLSYKCKFEGFFNYNKICADPHIVDTVQYIQTIQLIFEPVHEISCNEVCAPSKASDQPAHTPSLIRAFASRLSIL